MNSRGRGHGALVAGLGLVMGTAALAAGARKKMRQGRAPDDAPGFTARRDFGHYEVVGRSVTIARPREELFRYWRDFSNLARFMENLVKVAPSASEGQSVWTIRAPAGRTVEVETRIAREISNELIAWRSVEGSDIDTEGRVTFEDAPGERGTRVGLIVAYHPPMGEPGRTIAKLFRREPEAQARHDLKRFKMLMETGEIATSARRTDETRATKMENT